ncbi:MAG: class I SAM-dependent methyltransferase [Burkholderiales bacterium]|nr:class I SAM-dependent methyltransferase [Burkholderiales bacterium]
MADTDVPELPGSDLRWRVAGHPDDVWFWKSGGVSIANIGTMLSIAGKSFTDYSRALEFGCGCGRMLLHLKDVGAKVELHGVDIDAEAIAWAQAHIPWVRCAVNDGLPPLAFPDAHFDLVFNQSVFTHLDEQYQDAWLAELRRIVKPGGDLVLSVSGEHPFSQLLQAHREAGADPGPLLEAYRTRGIVFVEDDGWKGGPFPDFYHSTFHAPWYVFEHWSRYFDIKAYVVRGSLDFQDYLLLRRPEGDLPPLPASAPPVPARAPGALRKLPRRLWRELKYRVRGR